MMHVDWPQPNFLSQSLLYVATYSYYFYMLLNIAIASYIEGAIGIYACIVTAWGACPDPLATYKRARDI